MINEKTGALTIILHNQSMIYKGNSFTAEVVATGGSGTKATLTFTTPNTDKWVHMIIHIRSNVEAHYTLGESPTISAGSGTNFITYNRNRNSSNISGILGTKTAVAGRMTDGATISDFGTILEEIHFGNNKVGGEDLAVDTWILKQNTTYALELESEAASSDNMVEVDWYEHTDKVFEF